MFQTITDVQRDEATRLQQYIDNRGGGLRVSLRSITLTVGWYNMNDGEGFGYIKDGTVTAIKLPQGLWSWTCDPDYQARKNNYESRYVRYNRYL